MLFRVNMVTPADRRHVSLPVRGLFSKVPAMSALVLSAAVLSACSGANFGETGLDLSHTDSLNTTQNSSENSPNTIKPSDRTKIALKGNNLKQHESKTASISKAQVQQQEETQHAYAALTTSSRPSKRLRPRTNREAIKAAFRSNNEFYRSAGEIENTLSAQCRKILADTGIQTGILRSPTLSANVTSDKDFGIGASYDFVDLKRANLQEELALARCARTAVTVKLSQLLVTSSQASIRAGYLAKAASLRKGRREFSRIARSISGALNEGGITGSQAATLRQHLNGVKLEEAKARSEASRREIVDQILSKSFRSLDQNLIAADRRIHDIEERMRTADVFKIRGSINYNAVDASGSPLIRPITGRDNGVTGKIKISVRLGAFSKRRHKLEQISRGSRVDQHYEKETGALWRTKELAQVNRMMLSGLKQQRTIVRNALAEAKRNARVVDSEYEEELVLARIRGRIDVMRLKAELVGITATISDVKMMNRKLRFQQ